jgi:pimeloyl-ACP methyl ester carboxylesterase
MTKQTTSYKNIQVNFTDQGKGTALVLLHGFLENQSMWYDFIPLLTQKYRVITLDLLGHGKTDCLSYQHSMEDQADLVYHVLHELRIRKCVVIGHSMGGYVALAFADLYAEFIKGLVLLNSTPLEDSPERKTNRGRAIVAVKQNAAAFISIAIANLFSENNRTRLAETIESIKKEALKTPLQGVIAALEGMKVRKSRVALLHQIDYPSLVVLGKKDSVLDFEETVLSLQNTATEWVALADGHMSHLENTEELKEILFRFLKKI